MVNWMSPAEIARDGGWFIPIFQPLMSSLSRSSSRLREHDARSPGALHVRISFNVWRILTEFMSLSWEWFISLPFDFSFIFGKRKFRWPMVCNGFDYQSSRSAHLSPDLLLFGAICIAIRARRSVSDHGFHEDLNSHSII